MARHNQFDVNLFFCDWNEAQNMDEMAAKWPGVSKINLAARAAKLRKWGFDLKNMRDRSATAEFIEAVNAAVTPDEAATRLDVTLEHLKVRASQLRRQGVDVRTFESPRSARLNEIAHAIGFDTWRKLETAALNGEVEVVRVNPSAIVL